MNCKDKEGWHNASVIRSAFFISYGIHIHSTLLWMTDEGKSLYAEEIMYIITFPKKYKECIGKKKKNVTKEHMNVQEVLKETSSLLLKR